MKIKYLILLFVISSLSIYPQYKTIKLWDGSAPGTENKQDNEKINEGKITEVFQPDITVLLPENRNKNLPAVLVCPGGGYTQIMIDKEGYKIADWLNKNGIAAFVLKYRLNPEEAMVDVQRAMSLIRLKASEFYINPDNIGIIGFSAGGHLAGNLVTHPDKEIIKDKVDSTSCRANFLILVYGAVGRIVPLVNKDVPPTFFVHTSDDTRVPPEESINFYLELKKNNVPAEMHIYEQGRHGFALLEDRGPVKGWAQSCIEWMKVRNILAP